MKSSISAILFAIAIVVAAIVLGNAYIERSERTGSINVTGSGSRDFTSDLIVWEGSFSKENKDLNVAYDELATAKDIITKYLVDKGIPEDKLVFTAINSHENRKSLYNSNGNYIGDEFMGYVLHQSVQVESQEVEKIEKIAREVTELLNRGVQFYSQPPRYYYTKLADLKIEMISQATEDARTRAERIAENSGSKLGNLVSANMGIFQITGQNSDEDYSWGGTFNTADKNKTASINMKLEYQVKK